MMIHETSDAQRWDKAMRIARAEEMRAMNLRLHSELSLIKRELRLVRLHLFWCWVKRKFRLVFIRYPQVLRWKFRKLLINLELFGIECLLACHKLYDKFSGHAPTPSVDDGKTSNVKVNRNE